MQVFTPELTDREIAVLQEAARMYDNAQIAFTLNISVNTVKTHLANIYAKFGVNTREDAIRIGIDRELIKCMCGR